MNEEKKDNNNSENFLEKNIKNEENKDDKKSNPGTKVDENNLNNKATIEMRKEINSKKRKKIKIKAYCSKCYQFFENGPYSKICQNHLQKECNLIECQKINEDGDNPCIRKFTNINSANRHTHCLTKKDIELWDTNCEIQKCLGKKKKSDNKFLDILNNNNTNNQNNEKNDNKNFLFNLSDNNSYINMNHLFVDNNNSFFDNNSQNNISNNNILGLIEDIDKLHFTDNNNNNDSNIDDKNDNNKEIKNIFNQPNWINEPKDNNIIIEEKKEDLKEKGANLENYENLSIDQFFEIVQKETNITNNIKKKLVNAFKKKGILNVKILTLFYEKHKNWDFLIKKFKKVSSQIEGVALCIEFLLKKP